MVWKKIMLNKLFSAICFFVFMSAFQQIDLGQPKSYTVITVRDKTDYSSRDGGYLPIGKLPKEFSNLFNFTFEHISMCTSYSGRVTEYVGAVNTYKSASAPSHIFQFEELSFTDNTISFKTETFERTYYKFEGKYLKKGELVRFNRKKTAVLEGIFSKFVADEKESEIKMSFSYLVWEAPYYIPPDVSGKK
jgi:hypothetical protein